MLTVASTTFSRICAKEFSLASYFHINDNVRFGMIDFKKKHLGTHYYVNVYIACLFDLSLMQGIKIDVSTEQTHQS